MNIEMTLERPEVITYDENVLNFLDYTILILSQANSANDTDIIMDDFLSDDFIDLLSENSPLFSILAPVWVDVFSRVFITSQETDFSLKVLWIPVLIKKLRWTIENESNLLELQEQCKNRAEKDHSLYNYLTLLFIEGVLYSPEAAFSHFKLNTQVLVTSKNDDKDIQRLCNDIASLGW